MQTKKKPSPKVNAKPKALKKVAGVLPKKKQKANQRAASKATPQVKGPPEFTMKQVKEIVALIKDAGSFTSFGYKTDEFEIEISVASPNSLSTVSTSPPALGATVSSPTVSPAASPTAHSHAAAPAVAISKSERLVTSPMIGTFYRRPSPNAAPFVEVGDQVKPDTDICIVEVMKLLNTIPAGYSGTVSQILVEDGASIASGQALMVIKVS